MPRESVQPIEDAMTLTPQQEKGVRARGGDVLVMAGAGSGKTRVLVERYLSLLENFDVEQIVAVTFTDAAAAEMRERVRQAVTARPNLEARVDRLDNAIIGTIHSLCLQLLRDNPVEAGIDPAASVLSEDEADKEVLAACRDAVEAAAAGQGPGLKALLEGGIHEMERALRMMLKRRNEIGLARAAQGGAGPAEWEARIRPALVAHVHALVESRRSELAQCCQWLEDTAIPGIPDKLADIVNEVTAILRDPLAGDTDDLLDRLRRVDEIPFAKKPGNRGGKKAWTEDPKVVRPVVKLVGGAYEEIEPFLWNDVDDDSLPVLESLLDLFAEASARYESRKRELAALDYLDLEIRAIDLLQSSRDTAARYRSRFKHVLVDEAQDLNPTQFELLELLTRRPDGHDAESDAPERFFVGDVKQSIYRFRGSDVSNLTRLKNELEESGGAVVSLTESFRAHDALICAINDVMADVFGDAREDYEARMEPMTARRPALPEAVAVETIMVPREHAVRPDRKRDRSIETHQREVEADHIAQRIRGILHSRFPVWDSAANSYRPACEADIVILLRSLIHVDDYELALERHGISHRTAAGGDFLRRQEIIDLMNLLEWLAESDNEIALIGVLRSPFFAIDDQSILTLTRGREPMLNASNASLDDGRPGRIVDALKNPPDGVLPETRSRCQRAAAVLERLREEARTAAPEQVLERALTLTQYEASWAPLRGGDQVLANIRQFVGMARALGEQSLDQFVEHVRTLRDDLAARAPQAALDAGDAVRILSIHAAKGLEFPIVFLADAGGARSSGGRAETVTWRAGTGVSLTLERDVEEIREPRRRPAWHSYLLDRDEKEEAAEEKRLLYVAATRAADLLVVSGGKAADDKRTWLTEFWRPGLAPIVRNYELPLMDLSTIAASPQTRAFSVPPAGAEQTADAPLIGRRGAIPIRSSTPATALEQHDWDGGRAGVSDPLALVRGTVTHVAIQEWLEGGTRPEIRALMRRAGRRLDESETQKVAADVDEMLNRFQGTDLAAALLAPATRKYSEMPFSWNWDGIAVHGSIDLAYQINGRWHVIDFKTDRVENGGEKQKAATYLTQLGVYAGAIEAATGQRPAAGIMFLRTGAIHWADEAEINAAMAETRRRIDKGELILSQTDEDEEFADDESAA